jgi:hypothetical protein
MRPWSVSGGVDELIVLKIPTRMSIYDHGGPWNFDGMMMIEGLMAMVIRRVVD